MLHAVARRRALPLLRAPCARRASWGNPLSWRSGLGGEPGTGHAPPELDARDAAAKDAILEKLMQGRQPADLMLRCACALLCVRACVLTGKQARYSTRRVRGLGAGRAHGG
jgi:hypothetical protein